MNRYHFISSLFIFCSSALQAGQANWSLTFGAGHKLSNHSPLPAGTRFQLGVFTGGFIPTAANTASWVANWKSRSETLYNPQLGGFGATLTVEENVAPFSAGTKLYVWGYRPVSSSQSEWILLTDSSWLMPSEDPLSFPESWQVSYADSVILGSIDALAHSIQTAAVSTNVVPPFYFAQWQTGWFSKSDSANAAIGGPDADPDNDGRNNLMEYVAGTSPLVKDSENLLSASSQSTSSVDISFPGSPSTRATWNLLTSTTLQSWGTVAIPPAYDPVNLLWKLSAPLETKRFWKLKVLTALTP